MALLPLHPFQASASPLSPLSTNDLTRRGVTLGLLTKPTRPPRPRPRVCSSGQCPEADDNEIDEPELGEDPEIVEVDIPNVDTDYPAPRPEAKLKKHEKGDASHHDLFTKCDGEMCPNQAIPRPGEKQIPAQSCTHMAGRLFKDKMWTCCPQQKFADKVGNCCDFGQLTQNYLCGKDIAVPLRDYSLTVLCDGVLAGCKLFR